MSKKKVIEGDFKISQFTSIIDWERFLKQTLKIKRVNPKNIKFKETGGQDRLTLLKKKKQLERAMWDKFVAASYLQFIDMPLQSDPETAIPHMYTFENTGLLKALGMIEENPQESKIIQPTLDDVAKFNKLRIAK